MQLYHTSGLNYKARKDFDLNSPGNFEAMFIELIFPDRKNLIVGCIYRHGSGIPLREFTCNYLDPILEKISLIKKECVLMGDFNVDFIKSNDNNAAGDFFDMFSS